MSTMKRIILRAALVTLMLLPGYAAFSQSSQPLDPENAELHAEIRAYLLNNPEILMEMFGILEERKKVAEARNDKTLLSDNADDIFNDGFSYVGGNPDGKFTIVEFLDYQCGYCRKAHPQVAELLESDSDIRLIVKELPILGPNSELASRVAIATQILAGDEAYKKINDTLMNTPGQLNDAVVDRILEAQDLNPDEIRARMIEPDVTERLAKTRELAARLSISGTPSFIFQSAFVRGYVPIEQMRALVDEIRVTF